MTAVHKQKDFITLSVVEFDAGLSCLKVINCGHLRTHATCT